MYDESGRKAVEVREVECFIVDGGSGWRTRFLTTSDLPLIYQVKFRLTGQVKRQTNRFSAEGVYPQDAMPHLNGRELRNLCQAIKDKHDGAYGETLIPLVITKVLWDQPEALELPTRILRLRE